MTYAQYAAAEMNTEVVIEAYVQATQGWWESAGQGLISIYSQDPDGAYFLYNVPCTREQADKLVNDTKIWVKGQKVSFSGNIEIEASELRILEGFYKAVESLKIGDRIDLEGFLYWYIEVNPHITELKPAA